MNFSERFKGRMSKIPKNGDINGCPSHPVEKKSLTPIKILATTALGGKFVLRSFSEISPPAETEAPQKWQLYQRHNTYLENGLFPKPPVRMLTKPYCLGVSRARQGKGCNQLGGLLNIGTTDWGKRGIRVSKKNEYESNRNTHIYLKSGC